MAVKVRVEQSPLKVRVGQADAIKILSSAPIGSQTVKNVVGGIADVTALNVSGVSTFAGNINPCLLYTSPSPRDNRVSRMPSSA